MFRVWQGLLFAGLLGAWQVLAQYGVLPVFFFGEPLRVLGVLRDWVSSGLLFPHLGVTLTETLAAFLVGTGLGIGTGLWLGLSPFAARLLDPYLKAANAMPRVVLAPIFAMWFGLGMGSKIALGVTLVFFAVFFNVFQAVREVSPAILANARMLGASRLQLLRHVYWPAALSWVFSSLHISVGMAFVGAVVGEYLGAARGVGYLILQAEGVFDINAVIAGLTVLTICALVLDGAVTALERRLLAWRPAGRGG
jgi:NitT/TauT family transport system permease protein